MKAKPTKVLRADPEERELFDALQQFYGLTTHNKVFRHILVFATLDVGALPENKSWGEKQRKAWLHCRKTTEQLYQATTLQAAKAVLKKQKASESMSVDELLTLSRKELARRIKSK